MFFFRRTYSRRASSHGRLRQSTGFTEHRRWVRIGFIVGGFMLAIGAVWFLSWFSRAEFMTIQSIQIVGADPDIVPRLQANADQALNGSYLGLFARRNALLFPRDYIEGIARAFPSIDTAHVRRDGLRQLVISVNERKPVAVVCPRFPDPDIDAGATSTGGHSVVSACYFTDQSGYIFKEAPTYSDLVYQRYFVPALIDVGSELVGRFATSTEEFIRIEQAYALVRRAGIDVLGVLIADDGEYEMYTADMTLIYFNNKRSMVEQMGNLITFWNNERTAGRADTLRSLEHIDVRYGSNIFFY